MIRFLSLLVLLFVFNNSLLSQKKTIYKIINSNQLIVGSDTLKVGISKIQDHFTQIQIDSLGLPCEIHWDGDCDSGSYRTYSIKNKDYYLTYNSVYKEEFYLDGIEIYLNDVISVSLEDSLQLDYRCQSNIPILESLERISDYYALDTTYWHKQEGFWIKIYKNNDDVRVLSMHLHSKDKHYKSKKDFKVNGKVYNNESLLLTGVLLLGYSDSDSLVQMTSTDLEGNYFLRSDKVKKVDVVSLGYEVLQLDTIPKKGKYADFCLKQKVYQIPDLNLFRSGKIEYDTTSYLKQFPVVRDDTKVNYLSHDGCNHLDFEPVMIKAGFPFGGFKDFYERFTSQLKYKRKYKNKSVDIWFALTKYGKIEIEKITGDSELVNDEVERAFGSTGDWNRFRMRGRQMGVKMKMKLSFK